VENESGNRRVPLSREQAVAMTLLGVDWGARRIGLAIKPAGMDWPLPRQVLECIDEPAALAALREEIRSVGADGVVVGLPHHPDLEQARTIKRFCRKARRGTRGVRWFFVDESLTTRAAESISFDKPRRRAADDLAAALIVETFLGTCR
jgi:RNase H-fold protein (predicted Holliday junction resolvase)